MPGEDRSCAIDLLGKDNADEFVRQGDGAERQHEGSAFARAVCPSIGRPNGHYQRLRSLVAVASNRPGKLLRSKLLATAVQQDKYWCSARSLAV